MANNVIDSAQVEAILSGGQNEVNRYLVRTMAVIITRVEAFPQETKDSIAEHRKDCRTQTHRTLYGLIAAIGTSIGLVTPYVLRLFN